MSYISDPNHTPFLPKQYDPEEFKANTSDILVVEIDDEEIIQNEKDKTEYDNNYLYLENA